jgi:transposase
MRQKSVNVKDAAERTIKDIRRRTRKRHSAEDKIQVVLAGLRGEESIAALCRREGIAESLYYSWSKEFLEAGKKRLAQRRHLENRPHCNRPAERRDYNTRFGGTPELLDPAAPPIPTVSSSQPTGVRTACRSERRTRVKRILFVAQRDLI